MKTSEIVWNKLGIIWEKFKELPFFLKTAVHLFLASPFLVGAMSIAKIDDDAFRLMNSIAGSVYNIASHESKDSTTIKKPEIVIIDSTFKPKDDSTKSEKSETGKKVADNKSSEKDSTPVHKPKDISPKTVSIDIEKDLAAIRIHYLASLGDSKANTAANNLKNFFGQKIDISDPVSRENLTQNILKLPIEVAERRARVSKKLQKIIGVNFDIVQFNEANSTIIQIAHL